MKTPFLYPSFLELRNWGEAMCVNNLPKVATQWNSGATRESNPGHRARIPSALTTEPLSHTHQVSTRRLSIRKELNNSKKNLPAEATLLQLTNDIFS